MENIPLNFHPNKEILEEKANKGIKARLADVEKLADQFNKEFFLDKLNVIEPNLNILPDDLAKMTHDEICYYCNTLEQYNIILQKKINRAQGILKWCQDSIDTVVYKRAPDFEGYSYKERVGKVLVNDSYAQALLKLIKDVEFLVTDNSYITNKIDFLVRIGLSIAESKK